MKSMLTKAMGNSHQSSPYPRIKYSNNNQNNVPPQNIEDFERRWKAFIQSLDVTPQNIQSIDQLEPSQKMELLMNFESKNPKCSAFHYVTLIKGLRSFKMTNSKKKDEFQNAKQILSATEISLRTNNVEWVYDFLKHNGLEILVDYMCQTLLHLIKFEDIQISPYISCGVSGRGLVSEAISEGNKSSSSGGGDTEFMSSTTNQSLRRIFEQGNFRYSQNNSRSGGSCRSRQTVINRTSSSVVGKLGGGGNSGGAGATGSGSNSSGAGALMLMGSTNGGVANNSKSCIGESIKECIHLCLKCFRTILNNQKGCRMAFEHKDTINIITMCLLHPSYQTKSLVLDLLSAVCLIESGHDRVLKAFDIFKAMTGEEKRFETLMYYYRHHETLPLDDYNIDYAVSNMQFINIVVHSVDNINLRVYLQYEFTLLGLDNFLKKLQDRPGDRLNRQVDAYLDNTVDCSVLLEDAEAKDAYVSECERLEKDVATLQETLNITEAEKSRKLKESDERIRKAEKELEKAKSREDELSLLVESLRSKIRDINVNLSDRESDMQKEINELHHQLKQLTTKLNTGKNNVATGDNQFELSSGKPKAKPIVVDDVVDTVTDVTDSQQQQHHHHRKQNMQTQQQTNTSMTSGTAAIALPITSSAGGQIGGGANGNCVSDSQATDHVAATTQHNNKKSSKSNSKIGASKTLSNNNIPNSSTSIITTSAMISDVTTLANGMNDAALAPSLISSTAATSVGGDSAPLMKWNILRNQQGTVFEHMDQSHIEQHLDLDGFEKIFKLPNSQVTAENEYDIPPNADTIDGGVSGASHSNVKHRTTIPNKKQSQKYTTAGGISGHNNNTTQAQHLQHQDVSAVQHNNTTSLTITTSSPMTTTPYNNHVDHNNTTNSATTIITNNNQQQLPIETERISLLDQNRQKCLKVVVDYLKQEQLLLNSSITFREWGRPLARAITTFELNSESADRLLYQLPSYQEIDMYRDVTGDNLNVLADEDRLVALLSCIDRVEMKLEAILYMHAFDETYFALQEKIRTVALACKNVMDSERLKKILEIVLAFGNRMNDSRRGKAIGFRISSLDMLAECRSPDDKWSLLNYIVYSIDDKFPDLLLFLTELESVDDASRVSLCNLLAAIEELNQGLDRVAEELTVIRDAVQSNQDLIPMRLVSFVKDNSNRVSQLKNQAEQARIAFVKTVEWFGEKDLNTASPDLFFGTLSRFMDSFKKAMAENSRRKMGVQSDNNNVANHRRKHKDRKVHDKGDGSRKKNRTRQINADGIMDDILAGLDFQPLQAGLHGGRRTSKRDNGDSESTANIFLDSSSTNFN